MPRAEVAVDERRVSALASQSGGGLGPCAALAQGLVRSLADKLFT